MNVQQVTAQLLASPWFRRGVVAQRELPARPARFAPWPSWVDPRLRAALARRGIAELYTHQARAADLARHRQHCVVVTPTASGKTLCYNLPVLSAILEQPAARALYLFPTKALSQDQTDELYGLVQALGVDVGTHTYDGDTPASARRAIRAAGHIVITNPDMLHTGILPHHTRWVKLFENLRYVVIDELHGYRGVFGSHLANLVRRLRRVCQFYGADPTFVCCSATIANPAELAEQIVGAPVQLVADNGAPSSARTVIFFNPPVVNQQLGLRQSSLLAAREVADAFLANDVQTIVFARSRQAVELLVTYLRQRAKQPERVQGYRGGYLPNQRRAIERGLRDGSVRAVVATNALELGIDLGGLEACVIVGYPGSVASTWQQIGRVGRRDLPATSVLVASSSPLDQFLMAHPEYFFGQPPEAGLVNPRNLVVWMNHLKCAAFELPFSDGEEFGGDATGEMLRFLEEEGVLHHSGGRWHWMAEAFPAEEVSLRTAATDNFVVIDTTNGARVVGEVDRYAAPTTIHEEAIYYHLGEQYQVERLDWEEKKAYVRRVEVDYYTDANLAVALKVLDVFAQQPDEPAGPAHGEVAVTYLATIFKKMKLFTHENVGWGRIHLPEEEMHTTAVWFALAPAATADLNPEVLQGALVGLAHVLVHVAPLFLLCDPRDLRALSEVRSPFTLRPTVYLYDRVPGGVGLSERLYTMRHDLLRAAADLVARCPCLAGCPSCVGPPAEVGPQGKGGLRRLLERVVAAGTPA